MKNYGVNFLYKVLISAMKNDNTQVVKDLRKMIEREEQIEKEKEGNIK